MGRALCSRSMASGGPSALALHYGGEKRAGGDQRAHQTRPKHPLRQKGRRQRGEAPWQVPGGWQAGLLRASGEGPSWSRFCNAPCNSSPSSYRYKKHSGMNYGAWGLLLWHNFPSWKQCNLASSSVNISGCETGAAVPFLGTLLCCLYLWPAPAPSNTMIYVHTYVCPCFSTQLLSASHNLPIPNPSAAGGKPLYSGTLCITKQKGKSYIVPEIHGLFKHSQVHLLKYCPNSHLSTYKAYRLTVNQSRRCARGRQAARQLATSAAEPGCGSRSQKAGANYFTKYTQPRQ